MLQTFRDLGMGKAKLQDRILEEADYLTDIFGRNDGRSFDPFPSLFSSVSNIICALCFGKRFEHEDPEFLQILADLRLLTVYLAQAGPMSAYPVLRFLPGRLNRMWKSLQKITKRNQEFVRDMIEDHKSTYTETDTRDYIDAFLHEQRAEMQKPNGPSPAFHGS
jgi:Cytochrome P450